MADNSRIEWTDATSRHVKAAARRVGVSTDEYVRLRLAGLKCCWRCRSWASVASFGPDVTRYDGLAAICVSCRRPPKQMPLIVRTQAEYERFRYATDERYRIERRQRAHARKRGIDPMPIEGVEALSEKFGGLCAYCPAPATTWDHIVPVSQGGRTIPGNIVPACSSCNSRKGARDVYEFIESEGVVISEALDAELALGFLWGELS